MSLLPRNPLLTGMPWTRWPGSRAGCLTARSVTVPMHPSSHLNSWGSWHLLPMFPFPSPYLFGVGPHKASRPATFFPVSPLFDLGRRPGLKGRDALRHDAPRRLWRAGAVKDGRRPPRSGARKACVLDGPERRGTSPAVSGGLRGLSAPPAPSLGALGVPFHVKPCPPGCLDGLEPLQFGLGHLWKPS